MSTPSIRAWLQSRRVAVLMGGRSAERSISLKTGRAIFQSLRRQGVPALAIDAGANLPFELKKKKINFVFIALHGPRGEDGTVQGLLDWLDIPFTGSGVLGSAMAMDKVASKRAFTAAGLQTAPWFSLERSAASSGLTMARKLGFPLVVKPVSQGSAIGISIVRSAREWMPALKKGFAFGPVLLAEKFLSGPEITVGMLGDQVLPIIEIIPEHSSFYDFNAKYAPGGSRHLLPARLSAKTSARAAALSVGACRALGVGGASRVDLIVDSKRGPTLLEVNTIPGMTETSLLPEAAQAAGLSFDALVMRIAALARPSK